MRKEVRGRGGTGLWEYTELSPNQPMLTNAKSVVVTLLSF